MKVKAAFYAELVTSKPLRKRSHVGGFQQAEAGDGCLQQGQDRRKLYIRSNGLTVPGTV